MGEQQTPFSKTPLVASVLQGLPTIGPSCRGLENLIILQNPLMTKPFFFSPEIYLLKIFCFVADFNPSNAHRLSTLDRRSQLQIKNTAGEVTTTLQNHLQSS